MTIYRSTLLLPVILATAFPLVPTDIARAGTGPSQVVPPSAVPPAPDWIRLWDRATLYKNPANPVLQELKLRGRYHGQYHWLESEQGDHEGWEDRRSRLGIDATLFDRQVELRLDAQSTDGFDPFYGGLVDAFINWKPTPVFNLTLGRQKPRIGYYDWLQSTTQQPTFERSQIFNQLRVDRVTGAVAHGRLGRATYQVGAYSTDIDQEFGQFDGGYALGVGIGWDFKEATGFDRADVRVDWLHSDPKAGDAVLNRYRDLGSATVWMEEGRIGVVAEAFLATGLSDTVFGFFLQTQYDLVPETLQWVGRYSFAHGDGPDSVVAQSRYERAAPALTGQGRGETYHAAYLGLQYFLNGDQLKLLAGVDYAHLDGGGNGGDFDGWTVLSGVRFAF